LSSDLEGRILITLRQDADGQFSMRIGSTRPQLAQRLMAGRAPTEAAHLAGTLFTLCKRAQRLAADLACRAALGQGVPSELDAQVARRVLAEQALEHAWQLLVSWPEHQGGAPDLATLLPLRQAADDPERLAEGLETALRHRLLGLAPGAWLAQDAAGLDAWCRAAGTPVAGYLAALAQGPDLGISEAQLLPLAALDAQAAHTLARLALDETHWCARPLWAGRPAETGAIARLAAHPWVADWVARRGRGVGARQLARLLELARLPERLRHAGPDPHLVRAWSPEPGLGVAGVETARGLLLHLVRLGAGRVADYRIVAPTEWNFHPAGPIAESLSGLGTEPDPIPAARRIAHSLDACVAIEVRQVSGAELGEVTDA